MRRAIIFGILMSCCIFIYAQSSWEIRLFPQIAFGSNNTLQKPNTEEGTRINLDKEFDRNHRTSFSPRIELEYVYRRNHFIITGSFLQNNFHGVSKIGRASCRERVYGLV